MERKWLIGQGVAAVDTMLYCTSPLQVDGFTAASHEQVTSGGSGANLLVAAAQLGFPAALIAKVGDDAFGRRFRRELLADGVDDRYLLECAGRVTLHTYIAVAPDGERSIIVHQGDCYETLSPEELPKTVLDGAGVFYTDGLPLRTAAPLAALAAKKGVPVFYQWECKERGWDEACRRMSREIMDTADIISGGPDIYQELVGTDEPETALRMLYDRHRPASGVVMTAGRKGAWWYDGEALLHQPIFPVRSIDSTGAGDTFCGALIYAYYHRGLGRQESLRFAAACGAMKCMTPGPRLRAGAEEVFAFLERQEKEGV